MNQSWHIKSIRLEDPHKLWITHDQPDHPVEPFDFIAFGGTGDLAERKLLPALYQRQRAGQFTEPTRIIGASRTKMSTRNIVSLRARRSTIMSSRMTIDPEQLEIVSGAAELCRRPTPKAATVSPS
jgi:glucose-6-phosphate 1-dehydrogenase